MYVLYTVRVFLISCGLGWINVLWWRELKHLFTPYTTVGCWLYGLLLSSRQIIPAQNLRIRIRSSIPSQHWQWRLDINRPRVVQVSPQCFFTSPVFSIQCLERYQASLSVQMFIHTRFLRILPPLDVLSMPMTRPIHDTIYHDSAQCQWEPTLFKLSCVYHVVS